MNVLGIMWVAHHMMPYTVELEKHLQIHQSSYHIIGTLLYRCKRKLFGTCYVSKKNNDESDVSETTVGNIR